MFNERQLERYARHILLQEVGGPGQQKLLDSRVLVVGAGGLGSPLMLYLAAAGVGTVGVVDDDAVALSNLQRQIAHTEARIGHPKTESAAETVARINPDVTVRMSYGPARPRQCPGPDRALRPGRRRQRQFRDALPHQRRVLPVAHDPGLGVDPAFRRPARDLQGPPGRRQPLLSLHLPRSAAAGPDPVLRGRRHPRRRRGLHGLFAGDRGAEGAAGDRREPVG